MDEQRTGKTGKRASSERGYTLLATGLAIFGVMGMTALAIDMGRMYIAKNEGQAYADSAAITATLQLDGMATGIQRAKDAVAASANRWNFGNTTFSGTQVEFSTSDSGPWETNPASAAGYRFARVTAGVNVPLSFMRALAAGSSRPVNARAVAGQVAQTGMPEGMFPFSPFAHDPNPAVNFGLVPGQRYTLRWAASPQLANPQTTCPGDRTQAMIDLANAGGGEERGYIEETSSAVIRRSIAYDYQTVYREVGDSVSMTGGAKQTQKDALIARVRQDTDQTSETYAEYRDGGAGNWRRVVAAPINLGLPGGYQIVQFASFFLLTEADYAAATGGNRPFCAEYIGPYVKGSRNGGAGGPGYYLVRLVQ